MSSFHKSVFGKFGENIFTDLNGFAHSTPEEWMAAPLDAAGGPLTEDDAVALAAQTVEQCCVAEAAVRMWRRKDSSGEVIKKRKLNKSTRKVLLRAYEEKYRDLVWYYECISHGPRNIKGEPTRVGVEMGRGKTVAYAVGFKSVAIRRKYPEECAKLLQKDGMWFHGFNSGCLATCRHVAGLRGVKLEQDLDTEGGE